MPESIENDTYIKEFITSIYDILGCKLADKLEEMTHREDHSGVGRSELEEWKNSDSF